MMSSVLHHADYSQLLTLGTTAQEEFTVVSLWVCR